MPFPPEPVPRKSPAVLVGGPHCGLEVDITALVTPTTGATTYAPLQLEHNEHPHEYRAPRLPLRSASTGRLVYLHSAYVWKDHQ